MNRYLIFQDVHINIGQLYEGEVIPDTITVNNFYKVKIKVNGKYMNTNKERSVDVDIAISYDTIELVLGIPKRDLYLNKINKNDILKKLIELEFIKYIIINNLK